MSAQDPAAATPASADTTATAPASPPAEPGGPASDAAPTAATTSALPAEPVAPPSEPGPAGADVPAEEPAAEGAAPDDFRSAWVSVGARAGLYVPGIVNRMDPHVVVGLDVAVLLPFLERRFGVQLEVGWAPPGAGVPATADPRLGAPGSMSSWTASMTTDELFVGGGLIFRFLPPGDVFVPYLGVGGRVYFLRTVVWGVGAGEPFGENTEVSAQGGISATLGGELRLGPGALVIEAGFGWSDLPHTTTGATSTSAISAQLGYRFFF